MEDRDRACGASSNKLGTGGQAGHYFSPCYHLCIGFGFRLVLLLIRVTYYQHYTLNLRLSVDRTRQGFAERQLRTAAQWTPTTAPYVLVLV